MSSQEKDTVALKATLKTFPNFKDSSCWDWKVLFEKGVRTILANLENENKRWREERQRQLDSGYTNSAGIYEEIISFNKGRIFSLKQILGEL